jgi:hypothetical protein
MLIYHFSKYFKYWFQLKPQTLTKPFVFPKPITDCHIPNFFQYPHSPIVFFYCLYNLYFINAPVDVDPIPHAPPDQRKAQAHHALIPGQPHPITLDAQQHLRPALQTPFK